MKVLPASNQDRYRESKKILFRYSPTYDHHFLLTHMQQLQSADPVKMNWSPRSALRVPKDWPSTFKYCTTQIRLECDRSTMLSVFRKNKQQMMLFFWVSVPERQQHVEILKPSGGELTVAVLFLQATQGVCCSPSASPVCPSCCSTSSIRLPSTACWQGTPSPQTSTVSAAFTVESQIKFVCEVCGVC